MMRAMRFNSTDGVSVVQQCVPVPGPNQALVRVLRAGVCSTDLEITKGYVPGANTVHLLGSSEQAVHSPTYVIPTASGTYLSSHQLMCLCVDGRTTASVAVAVFTGQRESPAVPRSLNRFRLCHGPRVCGASGELRVRAAVGRKDGMRGNKLCVPNLRSV